MKLLNRLMATIGCLGIIGAHAQDSTLTKADIKACADCCRPQSAMPLGIMTDHIHSKGQWMLSYTYMNMAMSGNNASDGEIYRDYVTAPKTMTMQMHMAMLMYGLTNRITLMAMGGYVQNDMTMVMNPNAFMVMPGMTMPLSDLGTMNMSSSGFADTKIYGMYSIFQRAKNHLTGTMGINLPTGSVKATGTMFVADERLNYNMQPGTGSFGLLPSLSYVHAGGLFSYGVSGLADIKLNNNSQGYRFGNNYAGTAWAGYRFLPFLNGTVRMEASYSDKIHGYDAQIAQLSANDAAADGRNYGGTRMNGYLGLDLNLPQPVWNKFHLLAEYGIPVYEHLNGIQMASKSNLLAGIQYMF